MKQRSIGERKRIDRRHCWIYAGEKSLWRKILFAPTVKTMITTIMTIIIRDKYIITTVNRGERELKQVRLKMPFDRKQDK